MFSDGLAMLMPTLKFCKDNFRELALVSLCVTAPGVFFCLILLATPTGSGSTTAGIVRSVTMGLSLVAPQFIIFGAVSAMLKERDSSGKTNVTAAFGRLLSRLAPMLLTSLLMFGILLLWQLVAEFVATNVENFAAALLFGFIGAACIWMLVSFAIPLVVTEDIGPTDALKASFALAGENYRQALSAFGLLYLLLWSLFCTLGVTVPAAIVVVGFSMDPTTNFEWLASSPAKLSVLLVLQICLFSVPVHVLVAVMCERLIAGSSRPDTRQRDTRPASMPRSESGSRPATGAPLRAPSAAHPGVDSQR